MLQLFRLFFSYDSFHNAFNISWLIIVDTLKPRRDLRGLSALHDSRDLSLRTKGLSEKSEKTKEKENGRIRRRNAFRIANDVIVAISDRTIQVNLPKR